MPDDVPDGLLCNINHHVDLFVPMQPFPRTLPDSESLRAIRDIQCAWQVFLISGLSSRVNFGLNRLHNARSHR